MELGIGLTLKLKTLYVNLKLEKMEFRFLVDHYRGLCVDAQ